MQSSKWLRMIALLLLMTLAAASQTAKPTQQRDSPEDMQKLLTETARNYREAKSLRIEREMVGTTSGELLKVWDESFSKVEIAPGQRYRREEKNAYAWDIHLSDGTTEWTWHPWSKQYVEKAVEKSSDPEGSNPAQGGWVGWLTQIDKKLASGRVQPPEIIDVDGRRANCMVIIGPPSPRQQPDPTMLQQTTYWIDRDRKILVKEQFVMRSTISERKFDAISTTTYKVVELNPALADSLFRFVPAAGIERVEQFVGPVVLAGKAAPPLKLKTLDGRDFDLSSLSGKPVLVDFWATWCMPCRESMPHLAKLYDEFKDKGLAIVSVSKDDDPEDAARFVAKYKYSWTHLADPKGESEKNWGASGIPRLVLVGSDGKVLFESEGYDEGEDAKIRAALHKMDPSFPSPDSSR